MNMKNIMMGLVLLGILMVCPSVSAQHIKDETMSTQYYYYENIEQGQVVKRSSVKTEKLAMQMYDSLLFDVNYQSNTATVVSCDTTVNSIVIPDTLGGTIPVTRIEDYAFQGCMNLSSVVIPRTVTEIGDYAFDSCVNLKSVQVMGEVESYGTGVFYTNVALPTYTLPSDMTMIPERMFQGCTSMTSVTIPARVTAIGAFAFHNTNISSFEIGKNMTSIGEWAMFSVSLSKLTFLGTTPPTFTKTYGGLVTASSATVSVPKGSEAAYNTALTGNITFSKMEENTENIFQAGSIMYSRLSDSEVEVVGYYGNTEEVLVIPSTVADPTVTNTYYTVVSIGDMAFKNATKLLTVVIPATVTKLDDYAFGYSSVQTLEIPTSVTEIGEQCFFSCINLQRMIFRSQKPPIIGTNAYVLGLAEVCIPAGVENAYREAFGTNMVYKKLIADSLYGDYTGMEAGKEDDSTGDNETVPEETKIAKPTLKVKKKADGKRVLTYNNTLRAKRVVIYRATKKTGKYKNIANVKLAFGNKYTDKTAKKTKTYYYKVRTYRLVDGVKVYSKYSKIRKSA
ncbi:MAG: leucine-rich repeat protein [Lachnospiraceae bacterium]